MLERLKAMLIKEFIQVLRDPRMRFVIFVIPTFQVIVFGYAVNTDVTRIATAIYDLDNSSESRALIDSFASSGYFEIKNRIGSEAEMNAAIDSGDARAIIRVGTDYSEALRGGRTAEVQLIVDGSDSNTAGIILGYAGAIISGVNTRIIKERMQRAGAPAFEGGGVELHTRAWFNENLESRNFYVPAVIAMLILVITMLLSSMAVVREKEIGTIEQIIVTPISRMEFILGKTIPFVLIGFIDVAVVTAVASLWFQIPIRGSLFLLFGATSLFLMSSLGIGLLISTISRTQQQAMMSAFFVVFPAMLLSGFAFPIENMPDPIQWLTFLNPLRYYMVILRAIFLKGTGIGILWPQLAGLALLGSGILSFSIFRFHKTLT